MATEIDAVIDTILENAGYAEELSLAKAKLFATALRKFLILHPAQSTSPGGYTTTLSVVQAKQMLDEATSFITSNQNAANGGSSISILGARHGFR